VGCVERDLVDRGETGRGYGTAIEWAESLFYAFPKLRDDSIKEALTIRFPL
jgi:hypothetical protein